MAAHTFELERRQVTDDTDAEISRMDALEGPARARSAFWLLAAGLAILAGLKPIWIDSLDPDLFWHLLVGEQLLRDGIGPLVDGISYASIRHPWTPYSWLAELGMNAIWNWGGYRAALAAHAIILAGVMLAVAATAAECVSRSASRAFAAGAVATGAAMMLILPWFGFRPAAMAILLLAIVVWLLQRDRRLDERSRAIWCIVPITALLANIHLFALAVPLWVGAMGGGALIERIRAVCNRDCIQLSSTRESNRRLLRYALLTLLSAAGCCATPMLAGFVRTAAYYQFADPMVASGVIAEMRPFYEGTFGRILVAVLAVVAIIVWRNRRQVRAGEWLMLGIGIALLLQHGRYAPLFALTLTPVLTLTISDLSDAWLERSIARLVLVGFVASSLIAFLLVFPRASVSMEQWLNRRGPGHAGFPCGAANFVSANVRPRTGRLINEFTWGGYLAWRFQGRFQVLLDGRTQLYTPEFWRQAYLSDEAAREKLLAQTHADAAILPVESSRYRNVLSALNWRVVYADDRAIVMRPPE